LKPARLLPRRTRERLNLNRCRIGLFVDRAAREIPAGSHVLDAGAGEGSYRDRFREHRYVTADLGIGDARWDYSRLGTVCDLHRLAYRDASFDAVIATQVLEHLRWPDRFLAEVRRVLRPGGRLYLTAPLTFREHQRPHDYWRFTRFGLAALLEEAGFEEVVIEAQGGYLAMMGDLLQPMHRYLFGRGTPLAWRILLAPVAVLSKLWFTIAVPGICRSLDGLDRKRTHTTGFEVVAVRPEEEGP
jgi:SAM-dependent methyltransferase